LIGTALARQLSRARNFSIRRAERLSAAQSASVPIYKTSGDPAGAGQAAGWPPDLNSERF
jgi:hypothetical protein